MIAVLRREIALAFAAGGGAASALLFFAVVAIAMPFAIGPDRARLEAIGPATLWIGALLASLLGLERLFQADREDGTLDVLMMAQTPLPLIVFAKAIGHWLTTGLPLTLFAPVLALLFGLDGRTILATMATLAVGTPAISLIGTVGAAITVSLPRGGLLLAILVLPLCIPTIIFALGAVREVAVGTDGFGSPFAMLAAISLFFSVVGPFAAAYALRHGDG